MADNEDNIENVENDGITDGPDAVDKAAEEKAFSQADLDRLLQKRLKRQEDTFKKQLEDFEKYKADADSYQKLQNEKATDS